jgi:cation/acetate symporter
MSGAPGANAAAISLFLLFVAATLVITWLASRRAQSRAAYYTAGGDLSAFSNGLAIAGDYMSAAAFLGVSGLITAVGFDGMLYGIGFVIGPLSCSWSPSGCGALDASHSPTPCR